MVKVRVRQNDGVNRARGHRCILPVALAPFLLPLKKPAVDENPKSGLVIRIESCADKVLGTGYGPSRAEELDVGQELSPDEEEIYQNSARF